ncbi:hypothetical protein GCM10027056_29740 [Glaciibacter psychrotolerans]
MLVPAAPLLAGSLPVAPPHPLSTSAVIVAPTVTASILPKRRFGVPGKRARRVMATLSHSMWLWLWLWLWRDSTLRGSLRCTIESMRHFFPNDP